MAPFPPIDGLPWPVKFQPTPSEQPSPTLVLRQEAETVTVVSEEGGGGSSGSTTLSGGAIAGIVIGSVVGTLLLLWLIRSCLNLGAPPGPERESMYRHVEPERRRHRSKHGHSYRRSSDLAAPPPVVIKETSRPRRHPKYLYTDPDAGRGRRLY